jgi:hypothetical protein
MVTSVNVTTPVFDWEISYDQGQTWQSAGQSGRHTIYWTYDDPISPPFEDHYGVTYTPLYDEALSRACRYAAGETSVPDVVKKLAEGVDKDIWYSPWTLIKGHPLNAYAKGQALCWDNATLLCGLCHSLGIDATVNLYWGGQPNRIELYARHSDLQSGQSFRVQAPKHDDAKRNPHFVYHAMVEVSGVLYDPSYGVVRPSGLNVTETAQTPTGASYPAQTGLTFPFTHSTGWVCPH